jgi:hypothetical protein
VPALTLEGLNVEISIRKYVLPGAKFLWALGAFFVMTSLSVALHRAAAADPIEKVPQEIKDAVGVSTVDLELKVQLEAAAGEAQRAEAALKKLNEALMGPGAPPAGSVAREALLEARFAAKVDYEDAMTRALPLAQAAKEAQEADQKAMMAADEAFDKARCLAETAADTARAEFCGRRGIAVPKKLARAERGR